MLPTFQIGGIAYSTQFHQSGIPTEIAPPNSFLVVSSSYYLPLAAQNETGET